MSNIQLTIISLTNALDDESVIERLAHTTSVDEVLELLQVKALTVKHPKIVPSCRKAARSESP